MRRTCYYYLACLQVRPLVWELRGLVFRNGTLSVGLFDEFFEVHKSSMHLVLIGRALVCEMVLGTTDHAKVILATMFLLCWEKLTTQTQDTGEVSLDSKVEDEAEGIEALEVGLD